MAMVELIKEMKEDNRSRNEELVMMQRQAADRTEELMKLHRQASDGRQAHPEGRIYSPRDRIRRKEITASEDGSNIKSFLSLVEREFRDSEVPMEEWGGLLGKYLTGKALAFVEFLKQSGVDMTDWNHVRNRLCEKFCSLTRETMIDMLAENRWTGDYSGHIARFTDVVSMGAHIPAEELVTWFFTLLPPEIGERITREGTKEFHDWHEAAAALRDWAIPLEAWRARRIRSLQEFTARGRRRPGLEGSVITSGRTAPVKGDARSRPNWQTDGPRDQDVAGPDAISVPVSPNPGQEETGEGVKRRHVMLVGDRIETGNECNENEGGQAKPNETDLKGQEEKGEAVECGELTHGPGTEPVRGAETGNSKNKGKEENIEGDRLLPEWLWWQGGGAPERTLEYLGPLCGIGESAVLEFEITGPGYEGLLDTGASRSFIRPAAVEQLGLKVRTLREPFSFTVANGATIHIDKEVPRLTMLCGGECFTGDFLIGPIPFPIILGIDWLVNHKVAWYFQSDKLRTYVNGRWCDLPVLRKGGEATSQGETTNKDRTKTAADRAYEELAAQDILQRAREDTANLKRALEGLHFVFASPATEPEQIIHVPTEGQGPLLCALVEHTSSTPNRRDWTHGEAGETYGTPQADDDESPWPKAQLSYTEFDAWMAGPEAPRIPEPILTVLQQHRKLFPDSLPGGLPPKRPYDHRILLLPGKLPTRAPIYKMPPDQLAHHNKEIARLIAKGWIGPTYSPICAPNIMDDKRDDGSGERKMRMVVNHQALNALTIAPEFPMPSGQTVLEMLGGAAYFSTLDLEAGFHQIRMAREDRWKTPFRSVQGLFEYKVMPFGLKGAPATFQASINAYLQPLLGNGVITYLDDVLVYSAIIESHTQLLKQVLGIF
ncbi:uncharacterized protein EMH_0014960 [Eimeria mitis]|uniref:Reverse transcriptase domain-containing protein n=1 Tax=Eimeria mitis TaxID=44415 RepID=U6KCE5_9EIME|nr:uncharacterized protein EMH_0014960 [Eimeria mitis]CDJ33163.1 hypothetical protein EMH_0014960 [Eimeria mitis]